MASFISRFLLCGMLCLSLSSFSSACSRALWNGPGKSVFVMRTFDSADDLQSVLLAFPRGLTRSGGSFDNSVNWTSQYGSVVAMMTMTGPGVDGMNEKGLSVHLLFMQGAQFEARDIRSGIGSNLLVSYLLDNAATVEQASALLASAQVVLMDNSWPFHLAMEDSSGDSAVVEWVGGQMKVYKGRRYAVLTNEPSITQQLDNLRNYRTFGGQQPLPGESDSMSRFVRLASYLRSLPPADSERHAAAWMFGLAATVTIPAMPVDHAAAQFSSCGSTQWTAVYDLHGGKMYFAHSDALNTSVVDLRRLNLKGGSILALDPRSFMRGGDATTYFRPSASQ